MPDLFLSDKAGKWETSDRKQEDLMSRGDWIRSLAEDEREALAQRLKESLWPRQIAGSYERLLELMQEGNVYGALLQMKELYEVTLKIPALMALIYVSDTRETELTEDEEILKALVQEPLAMGHWRALVQCLEERETLALPRDLNRLLRKTRKLFFRQVTQRARDVVNWRNNTIGHGALKFEDNPAYREDFTALLSNWMKYVQEDLKADRSLYSDLRLETEPAVLLRTGGAEYPAGKFSAEGAGFLDSFYLRKKTVKYLDYGSGEDQLRPDTAFADYTRRLRGLTGTVKTGVRTRGEDQAWKQLNQEAEYIRPEGLLDRIRDFVEDHDRGILVLCMERGTGKSALARELDGLYRHSGDPVLEDAVVRSFPVSETRLQGLSIWFNELNGMFARNYDSALDLVFEKDAQPHVTPVKAGAGEAELARLREETAGLLSTYLQKYKEKKDDIGLIRQLVLVVDGIDELSSETRLILDGLPRREQLAKGIYLILTMRLPEEEDVGPLSRELIGAARAMADPEDGRIEIRRTDPENEEVLEAYLEKTLGGSGTLEEDRRQQLLDLSHHRFLELRLYAALPEGALAERPLQGEALIRAYLEYLFAMYTPSYRQQAGKYLAALALYGELSLEEYFDEIAREEISFEFVSIHNDLSPLLSSASRRKGRVYSLANAAYREYLLRETVPEQAQLAEQVREDLTGYLNSLLESLRNLPEEGSIENPRQYFASLSLRLQGFEALCRRIREPEIRRKLLTPKLMSTLIHPFLWEPVLGLDGDEPEVFRAQKDIFREDILDLLFRLAEDPALQEGLEEPAFAEDTMEDLAETETRDIWLKNWPGYRKLSDLWLRMIAAGEKTDFWEPLIFFGCAGGFVRSLYEKVDEEIRRFTAAYVKAGRTGEMLDALERRIRAARGMEAQNIFGRVNYVPWLEVLEEELAGTAGPEEKPGADLPETEARVLNLLAQSYLLDFSEMNMPEALLWAVENFDAAPEEKAEKPQTYADLAKACLTRLQNAGYEIRYPDPDYREKVRQLLADQYSYWDRSASLTRYLERLEALQRAVLTGDWTTDHPTYQDLYGINTERLHGKELEEAPEAKAITEGLFRQIREMASEMRQTPPSGWTEAMKQLLGPGGRPVLWTAENEGGSRARSSFEYWLDWALVLAGEEDPEWILQRRNMLYTSGYGGILTEEPGPDALTLCQKIGSYVRACALQDCRDRNYKEETLWEICSFLRLWTAFARRAAEHPEAREEIRNMQEFLPGFCETAAAEICDGLKAGTVQPEDAVIAAALFPYLEDRLAEAAGEVPRCDLRALKAQLPSAVSAALSGVETYTRFMDLESLLGICCGVCYYTKDLELWKSLRDAAAGTIEGEMRSAERAVRENLRNLQKELEDFEKFLLAAVNGTAVSFFGFHKKLFSLDRIGEMPQTVCSGFELVQDFLEHRPVPGAFAQRHPRPGSEYEFERFEILRDPE